MYAFDLLMCAVAYTLLQAQIIKLHGTEAVLARAVGADIKGKASVVTYLLAIPLALLGYAWFAVALVMGVTLLWFVPDRRIERVLTE